MDEDATVGESLSMKRKCLSIIRNEKNFNGSESSNVTPSLILPNGMRLGDYACKYVYEIRLKKKTDSELSENNQS